MEFETREPAIAYGKLKLTIPEYLAWEKEQIFKHEYLNGEVFAMSGAKRNHNEVFTNIFGAFCDALKNKPCRPYGSDMRMHIPANTLFTYPDITIYCEPIYPSEYDSDTLNNPTVIVEILSPSTRNYDRDQKFSLYKEIPALMEYMLVDSKSYTVEIHRRTSVNTWEPEIYNNLEEVLTIQALDFKMSLADIYNKVNFNRID